MKILIFSGTTEGRKLSKMLSDAGISHTVSVATKYGSEVMDDDGFADVIIGRMDHEAMKEYLRASAYSESDVVVDATHPYAEEVSANIRAATSERGCTLYRVSRSSETSASDTFRRYDSMAEFATYIDKCEGNILLTTGTNTLKTYRDVVSAGTLARTFVRILPAKESLEICLNAGIEGSHMIAMQGPFSHEMNRAVLVQYNISHMLTKDSGATGGFAEKISAAKELGTSVHVLERPCRNRDDGADIYEIYKLITGTEYTPKRRIMLIGTGPSGERLMTKQAIDTVRTADAVFGANSVTANINACRKYDMYRAGDIINVLEKEKDIVTAAVLYSGDTGFYSGAKEAYKTFKAWNGCDDVSIIPGVSSVSYLAAATGESYDDAAVTSIHGKSSEEEYNRLAGTIKDNRKTFSLVSSSEDVSKIAGKLKDNGTGVKITVGRNLLTRDECIETLTVDEALKYDRDGKITLLFISEDHTDNETI